MKKILKCSLVILLIISLAFLVTGCGTNNEGKGADSKIYKILNKTFSSGDYIVTLEGDVDIGEGLENGVITLAVRGEDIYMDIDAPSDHMSIMYKDDTTYVISHTDKMYMTSEGKDEEMFEEDDNLAIFSVEDLDAMAEAQYTTGKEAVDGTEYDYEEFKDEAAGVTDKYYFSGEDLVYIKTTNENGEEDTMKVIKLSSEVDDNIFNVPEGYEKF